LASASLTACVTHTTNTRPNADAFLQPTVIEDRYPSMKELMADPFSTTRDIINHGNAGDDANLRCNDDKASARKVLGAKP